MFFGISLKNNNPLEFRQLIYPSKIYPLRFYKKMSLFIQCYFFLAQLNHSYRKEIMQDISFSYTLFNHECWDHITRSLSQATMWPRHVQLFCFLCHISLNDLIKNIIFRDKFNTASGFVWNLFSFFQIYKL